MINRSFYSPLFVFFLSLLALDLNAQLNEHILPMSQKEKFEWKQNVPTFEMPSFDLKALEAEDALNDQDKSGPWRFGHNFDVQIDLMQSAHWVNLPSGDKIGLLQLTSKGALSLNVIFERFYLPKGVFFHMYNEDKSHIVGAYTDILNNPDQMLGTELVEGDQVFIEVYIPGWQKETPKLVINTVTHGYRSINLLATKLLKGLNDSGNCNIDVLCPLGQGWEQQIKSVAMIVSNGNGICTGALINNTAQDAKPYFLTANHCLGNPANWLFRFNWHSTVPSCATTSPSTSGPFNQTTFNATTRARSSNSDFALLELNNPIPSNWDVFFAGWDRTDIAPTFTIGIHHPRGDVKKICRDDDAPYHITQSGVQVWRVDQWEHGVTEPASSGSPLFDPQGRIIGQLYGGLAACLPGGSTQNNGQYDIYGRVAVSWNGNSAATRLRDWLDPLNTGLSILDGFDPNAPNLANNVSIQMGPDNLSQICATQWPFTIQIRNLGSETLQTLDIYVDNSQQRVLEYQWTGSLNSGQLISIELPDIPLQAGMDNLVFIATNPNGQEDEDPSNNETTFQVLSNASGAQLSFNLSTDCWGSENTWSITNSQGEVVASSGPYPDISGGASYVYDLCLEPGCYTFELLDSYGDGLYGSQYTSCNVNGDYSMLDADGIVIFQMTAPNGDFGNAVTHQFCVEGSNVLLANFESDIQVICSGQAIQFNDISEGDVTERIWHFEGGTPSTSTEISPLITYFQAGSYDVTLIVSSNGQSDTLSIEAYVSVSDLDPVYEVSHIVCASTCDAFIQFDQESLPTSYILTVNGVQQESILLPDLCAGIYQIEISSPLGCIWVESIEIIDMDSLNWEILSDIIHCNNPTTCAEIQLQSDRIFSQFTWNGMLTDTIFQCNLSSGTHSLNFQDQFGCMYIITFDLDSVLGPESVLVTETTSCADLCDGTVVAETTGIGPFQYLWSESESDKHFLTGLCAGAYQVSIIDAHACIETISFEIAEGAEAPGVAFEASAYHVNLEQATIEFSNFTEGATAFWWDLGDGTETDDFEPIHTYQDTGSFRVILYAFNGTCMSLDSVTIFVSGTVSTLDMDWEQSWQLVPNPTRESFRIGSKHAISDYTLEILDSKGTLLGRYEQSQTEYNVAHLPTGMYFIRLSHPMGSSIKKLVIIQ